MRKANLDPEVIFQLSRISTPDAIEKAIDIALKYHEKFDNDEVRFKDSFFQSEDAFRQLAHSYTNKLETLKKYAQAIKRRYLILIGSAGNGKTNLLCSIAELSIKIKQPTFFIN